MPKISVIVPVYNVEKYINRCLISILNQTLSDIEVIIVNDGSPDRCGEIVEEYKEKDNRIKVIHKKNGGLSSARNLGLEKATGEYISFVDSDDFIEETMLEVLYNNAKKEDADLSVCKIRKFSYGEELNYLCKAKNYRTIDMNKMGISNFFYDYWFPYVLGHEVCNKIYKASIISNYLIRFEPNKIVFAEDFLFNLYYLCHVNKVSITDDILYNYLQREGSLMKQERPNIMTQYLTCIDKFLEYTERVEKHNEFRIVIPFLLYRLINVSIARKLELGVTEVELKKEFEKIKQFNNLNGLFGTLAFGRETMTYCTKTKQGFRKHIRIRIISFMLFLKLNHLLAKYIARRLILM